MNLKLGKSYITSAVKVMKGNDNQELATKNAKQAEAAIKSQISAIEGSIIDAEQEIEAAKEALNSIFYPTEAITDRKAFTQNLYDAKKAILEAEETLSALNENKKFFEEFLEE